VFVHWEPQASEKERRILLRGPAPAAVRIHQLTAAGRETLGPVELDHEQGLRHVFPARSITVLEADY